jgi:hypothetical protein
MPNPCDMTEVFNNFPCPFSVSRYAHYHAVCWGYMKPRHEIEAEIARVEAKFSHTYTPNEVGNRTLDRDRIATLRALLKDHPEMVN